MVSSFEWQCNIVYLSRAQSQHPSTQWNQRGGRWTSVVKCTATRISLQTWKRQKIVFSWLSVAKSHTDIWKCLPFVRRQPYKKTTGWNKNGGHPPHFTLLVAGQGSRKKLRPFNWRLREHDDPFCSHSRAIIILVVHVHWTHSTVYRSKLCIWRNNDLIL